MELSRQKSSVAWLSVISNTLLVLLKLIIGVAISSVSVISEAIHSGVDLLAAIIALFAVKTSGKPADHDHPFGHGKVENVSGTVEAILIFLAALWIIFEAVHKLLTPGRGMKEPILGIFVMLFSAAINIIVSQMLFRVGKKTDSIALQADAWHLRTDVLTSLGVMIGLLAVMGGARFLPNVNLQWVDPVAALIVAFMIIRAAWDLTIKSSRDLLDASLPADEELWISERIESLGPTIRGFHNLRTRKSGSSRFVDFHLIVDPSMSVEESHRMSDVMTAEIKARFPDTTVTVHIEPCDGQCKPKCSGGCLLSEEERQLIRENTCN